MAGVKIAVFDRIQFWFLNFICDWRKNCGSGKFFDFQIEFLRLQIEFWPFWEIEFLRKRPKKTPG